MPIGIAIRRDILIVLDDGTYLLDWEQGVGIDLLRGEFIRYSGMPYSHPIQDDELETLKRAGRVISFDALEVIFSTLPEVPPKN
jgi:hypothetical protein